jgi:hypothetical protein
MVKSNGGIIGPDNVTTGGFSGVASGVFKLGEVTDLIRESKWPQVSPFPTNVTPNSARFNIASSDYLSRTPSSAGNRKIFTYSVWIKRSKLGVAQQIIGQTTETSGNDYFRIIFDAGGTTDQLRAFSSNGSMNKITSMKFRDTSAWYHIVCAFDTTQSTAANRNRFYVNGVEQTSFATNNNVDLNTAFEFNITNVHTIGRKAYDNSDYFGGYMSEAVLIDGTQLTPTSFGEFNSDSGIWVPKAITGLTFGTNGFYLPFTNASALGEDFSGEDNDWTVSNLTSIDQSTDSPSNNFATMNPLDNYYAGATFSEGNLKFVHGSSPWTYNTSTFGLSSGLWYWEMKCITANQPTIGIANRGSAATGNYLGENAYAWSYRSAQQNVISAGSQVVGSMSTFTDGDIISVYLDLTANKLYFAKNGTLENSGTGISLTAPASTTHGVYFPAAGDNTSGGSTTWEANFGNPSFTGTDKADANGYGSFEYDPSSGTFDGASKDFLAICTNNLNL